MLQKKSYFSIKTMISFLLSALIWWSCQTSPSNQQKTGLASTQIINTQPIEKIDTVVAVVKPSKLVAAKIDSNSRVIYLTMDDGPLAPSDMLRQIAEGKNIKISEFAVGKHAFISKTLMHHLEGMQASPNMEVLNHSYSHANGRYEHYYHNPEFAFNDITNNQNKLNITQKIVRMPGRDIWATPRLKLGWKQNGGSTASMLFNNGYIVYGWDIEWEHYGKSSLPKVTPEKFVAMIDDAFTNSEMATHNHLVILGHDEMLIHERGKSDFVRIVDMLIQRGYVFEFISNYP